MASGPAVTGLRHDTLKGSASWPIRLVGDFDIAV